MSITVSALLVVAAAVLATLAGRAVLGRLIPAARAAEAEPTAQGVIEAMAALYGVLVAFVLAGTWDRLDQTRLALTLEANAITDLQQTARILPAPTRNELGHAVDAYRESVLEELRLLAAGQTSTEPDALVDRILRILAGFQPETAGQAELQSRAFDAVGEMTDQRGIRLVMARRAPPALLWVILIGGGAAVLAVAAASSLGGRLRAAYVVLLAAVISLALFVIYALSHPVRSGLTPGSSHLVVEEGGRAAGECPAALRPRWPRVRISSAPVSVMATGTTSSANPRVAAVPSALSHASPPETASAPATLRPALGTGRPAARGAIVSKRPNAPTASARSTSRAATQSGRVSHHSGELGISRSPAPPGPSRYTTSTPITVTCHHAQPSWWNASQTNA